MVSMLHRSAAASALSMRKNSFALRSHTGTPAPYIQSLDVTVERASDRDLQLVYVLRGDMQQLEIAASRSPRRTDDLWRQTCFEAFLRTRGQAPYLEFNFSPSSEWAAYSFESY